MQVSSATSTAFTHLPGLFSQRSAAPHAAGNPVSSPGQPSPSVAIDSAAREVRNSPLAPVSASSASARTEQEKTRADAEQAIEKQRHARQEQLIQNEIKALAARDREVRAHEQAHMAAGGQYAGAATYQYQRGPNGVNYAVGGEVPISTSEEATPEATLRKAQIIRRAALAPAEPSPQDRKVAAMATQMESAARAEIARERTEQSEQAKATAPAAEDKESVAGDSNTDAPAESSASAQRPDQENAKERLQRKIFSLDGSENRPAGLLFSHMA